MMAHWFARSSCLLLTSIFVYAVASEQESSVKAAKTISPIRDAQGSCSAKNCEAQSSVSTSKPSQAGEAMAAADGHFPNSKSRVEARLAWSMVDELPDQPVQLVYPDPSKHRELLLREDNINLLRHIKEPVATVAVVGKYHSGKSFLLNQLMGKQAGFGVGPFVRPQTMGIWMWGQPLRIKLPSGQQVALIFLDTEGFAATNVSESYDAKVFAVATLLSSYLIYNSVKIIDQGDIDYLELLARRTQLFALKSQMSNATWTNDFNHDLLEFPPLLWVVQDFVQQTESEETPTDWLQRLMTSSMRDSEEHQISLKAIFPSVDCHTLFLPATSRVLLQDLSKAREEDLTPEYKAERDELMRTLRRRLVPKEKNGRPVTGPELASLLEILVDAANEGSLAQIPSRWNSFLEKLERTAKEDCLAFYEAEMTFLHDKYDHGPVPPDELQEWHEVSRNKSVRLLTHLLFGLGSVVNESSRSLVRRVQESVEKAMELNTKKTLLKCSEVQAKLQLEAEEALQKIQLPVKSSQLEQLGVEVQQQIVDKYRVSLEYLSATEGFNSYLDRLAVSVGNVRDSYALKNKKALEIVLKKAVDAAAGIFDEHCENKDDTPRTRKVIDKVIENAKAEAVQGYRVQSGVASEEALFEPFLAILQSKLSEKTESILQHNDYLVKVQAEAKVNELVDVFRERTGSSKISLPRNETDLKEQLNSELQRLESLFLNSQDKIEQVCAQRRHENMVAYSKVVELPLKTSKKVVLLSAATYDTEFSLKLYIREVCLVNLDEGKAKHWPVSLKHTIIDNFIRTDAQLQKALRSKQGLYSKLKGWVQWLLWILNMYNH